VLFVSGDADHDAAPDGVLAPGAAFLQKPFSPDALARKVREALAPRPAN
jgi:DNA-binding NtrC family response regulator